MKTTQPLLLFLDHLVTLLKLEDHRSPRKSSATVLAQEFRIDGHKFERMLPRELLHALMSNYDQPTATATGLEMATMTQVEKRVSPAAHSLTQQKTDTLFSY
jgi:hypothetical protein